MVRLLRWSLIVGSLLFIVLPLTALAQEGQAAITSPRANAIVQGTVSVQGIASHPDFWKYEVWIAPGLSPREDQWSVIYLQEEQQVPSEGQLAIWNTVAFPDGVYSLRLRVVRSDGNYDEVFVSPINVANAAPPPTATPEKSPTPEGTPTPLPTLTPSDSVATLTPLPTFTPAEGSAPVVPSIASPTVVAIDQPESQPTSTPPAVAAVTTPGPNRTSGFPEGLDLNLGIDASSLSSACFFGMGITLAIFLMVGLLALIRQVVRWMM